MKYIKLTQNQISIIDNKYYQIISKLKWFAKKDNKNNKFYACRRKNKNENWYSNDMFLHQYIIVLEGHSIESKIIDHINGDSLDNRIDNLRISTHSQNLANRPKQINNTSGYKGVIFDKRYNLWYAKITVNKQKIFLGCFKYKKDAAKAYNIAALKYFKNFAYLNKV